jgi:hypothetical protein
MTPEQKAKNLIKKLKTHQNVNVCINEILRNFKGLHKPEYCRFDIIGERKFIFKGEHEDGMTGYDMIEYWKSVKRCIKNIRK